MLSALRSPVLLPVVCSPLAVLGAVALVRGVPTGTALLVAWVVTVPLGRALARAVEAPGVRTLLLAGFWGLVTVAAGLGGYAWGVAVDPWAGLAPGEAP
ncbi:hypothetical protein [Cellulomonas triticagri]|uniref:hypothetical protein n=1 Tax=Cellulomonas triticagri TaxID=2483352 RepID=UPI0011C433CE|nr:hypothetical protein [Cellulomonas triticagri]